MSHSVKMILFVIVGCTISLTCQARAVGPEDAISSSSPLPLADFAAAVNSTIAEYVVNLLDGLPEQLQRGNSELNIPIMDPMQLNRFNYTLNNAPIGFAMDIKFNNVVVSGLSRYQVESALADPNITDKVQLKFTIPSIKMNGRYSMSGNLFAVFPLISTGEFDLISNNLILSGEGVLGMEDNGLQMVELNLKSNEAKTKTNFRENGPQQGQFSGVASELLGALGPQIFQTATPLIQQQFTNSIKTWLNTRLAEVSITDTLGLLGALVPK